MTIEATSFNGLFVIQPKVFGDDRGYFFESYKESVLEKELGRKPEFIQDNESLSGKGVLRGLHFQKPPHAQSKLVRVVTGAVLDVVVDLRKNEPTYGKHFAIELNAENKKQLFVPKGFAHGFLTLEDNTRFCYKCEGEYAPQAEDALLWNDTTLNINWPNKAALVSEKDAKANTFSNFISPF